VRGIAEIRDEYDDEREENGGPLIDMHAPSLPALLLSLLEVRTAKELHLQGSEILGATLFELTE
jgi:hypothetical protein